MLVTTAVANALIEEVALIEGIDDAVANADIVDDIDFDAEDVTVAKPDNALLTLTLILDEVVARADNVLVATRATLVVVVALADCELLTDIVGVEDSVAKALRLADLLPPGAGGAASLAAINIAVIYPAPSGIAINLR